MTSIEFMLDFIYKKISVKTRQGGTVVVEFLKYVVFLMSIAGFILMWLDKLKSTNMKWRISENTFFIVSIFGGGIGILLGGMLFHHKTSKNSFLIKISLGFIINILIFYFIR